MGRNLDMVIKIKYFGLIANNLISEAVLREGSDVTVLLNHLIKQYPNNKEMLNKATILVNKSKATTSTILNDKDEVMILTVLGGG
ncbi:MAG: MoaD/ThiS family protein [Bacteroidales bacterium]|jgi:molybdopterin converting factor small subunit